MALAQSGVKPSWLSRRLTHINWWLVRWSAAAGGLGGLLGWAVGEPLNGSPGAERLYLVYIHAFFYFLVVSAGIGAVLGALPGLLNRSHRQAIRGALTGILVGGLGGGLGALPAQFMYNALGDGLLARAVGWAIVGTLIGLCPGAATRDRRRALRGLVGGAVGGFVGGLLFNVVAYVIPRSATDTGTASRFIADIVVGVCIGVMVALVEVMLKKAWLRVISGRREGAEFILSKDTTSIGCDDRDDVILWGDKQMATRHARIRRGNGRYLLESLSAEAPTWINQHPVSGTVALQDGDEIILGATRLRFQTHSAPPGGSRAPSVVEPPPIAHHNISPRAAVPALPRAQAPVDAGFRLVALDHGIAPHDLSPRTILTIGRAQDNDMVLDDVTVSGRHAELRWEDGRWVIYDLGSTNGTYVSYNGTPESERPVERNALKEGSAIRVGQVRFRLERWEAAYATAHAGLPK